MSYRIFDQSLFEALRSQAEASPRKRAHFNLHHSYEEPVQLIATLYRLNVLKENKELADRVLAWTIDHMQDLKRGYFYYQLKQTKSSKIPYMRWAQAWMFYAFSFYFLELNHEK